MESQGVHFDGEIHGRPIVIGDILELDENIGKAYGFLHECDDDVKKYLKPVIDCACYAVCNMCFELGFETPDDVCNNPYYFFIVNSTDK